MLSMLLRLMVILRNKNGDATMHDYVDDSTNVAQTAPESDFTPLDAFSAIFIRDTEVIATCHIEDKENLILVDEDDTFQHSFSLIDYHDETHDNTQDSPGDKRVRLNHNGLNVVTLPNATTLPNAEDNPPEAITHVSKGMNIWPQVRDSESVFVIE